MTNLEKCQRAYALGATDEQLQVWVKAGKITEDEYNSIVGSGSDTTPSTEGYYSEEELSAAYQEGVESIG